MPKGMLTFDLPEEEEQFREAQAGPEWKYLVLDILNHLRTQINHNELSQERLAAFEEVRELIWHSIEDRKLKAE